MTAVAGWLTPTKKGSAKATKLKKLGRCSDVYTTLALSGPRAIGGVKGGTMVVV